MSRTGLASGSISGSSGRIPNQHEETPARSKLQHEQPVALRTPPSTIASFRMDNQAVDLSDLQNFLSWDMYGIMVLNESGLKAGIEGNALPS